MTNKSSNSTEGRDDREAATAMMVTEVTAENETMQRGIDRSKNVAASMQANPAMVVMTGTAVTETVATAVKAARQQQWQ